VSKVDDLLRVISRTFALAVSFLPEPTATEVGVSYLLLRAIGAIGGATHRTISQRLTALDGFVKLLDQAPTVEDPIVLDCLRRPSEPFDQQQVRRNTSALLEAFHHLRLDARVSVRRHAERCAARLSAFVVRSDGPRGLELGTLDDLRDYCYAVSGIGFELATELLLLNRPKLAPVADDLRTRAPELAEGLHIVKALRNARPEQTESAVRLPRRVHLRELFAVAAGDLAIGATYAEILRLMQVEPGLAGFSAFLTESATANLAALRDHGLGTGLSQLQLSSVADDVARRISQAGPLFAPL
jgi:farnesyl-diphosphate farnesyltransferase